MKLMDKLRGIGLSKVERVRLLDVEIADAEGLSNLQAYPEWARFQSILDKLYNEAVQKLGATGLKLDDWQRINHRVELLHAIRDEVSGRIANGRAASAIKEEILKKERENVRPKSAARP